MPPEGIPGPEGVRDQKDSATEEILIPRYPPRKMRFWYNRLKIRPIHSDLSPKKTPTLSRTLIYKYRFSPTSISKAQVLYVKIHSRWTRAKIARINWRRLWETLVSLRPPPRSAPPPETEVLEEEGEEEAPVPVLPAGRRRDIPRPEPPEVPPQWLARLEHLQKGLQDVKYQIEGTPEDERQGVPFTNTVMADELLLNCHTPAIAEYDGRHNNGSTSCLWALSETFKNSVPFFCTKFASSRKLRKTELSLFAVRQKDDEPLKEYLQRFNTAALEVPATTQEVKASAFSQGLLDGDFFKSLAKKPVAKFDALLARATKYINMEEAQAAKKETRGRSVKRSRRRHPPRNLVSTLEKENPLPKE
ncbi:UNVERIFIED_CONTAM: hypothetical protein Slati_3442900 [Sesamum latifolium]|uniref:Retrotransposon gag domain-containing protein n=1 Tax=Sesamum latifolium TaxID=2727402 RepID=A0AAW2UFK3_9LAMI